MRTMLASTVIAVALAATAFSAPLAQTPARDGSWMGMMGGGCPMMGMMGPGGMRGQMGAGPMGHRRMGALAEGRLAYLRAELDITAAQEPAWEAYATAVRERAGAMQDMRQSMMRTMRDGTAPERMAARIAAMEAMLESLKAVKPAIDGLYGALSDEQKVLADDLIGRDCGAM